MKRTRIERDLSNIRKMLRVRMEWLARSHRGCEKARKCGCAIDKTLDILEQAERAIFSVELERYASHTDESPSDAEDKTKAAVERSAE